VDDNTYKRRGILLSLSQFYTDLYMKRNWLFMHKLLHPKMAIFLGDLMDGGREWDDKVYFLRDGQGLIVAGRKSIGDSGRYFVRRRRRHILPHCLETMISAYQIQSRLPPSHDSKNISESPHRNFGPEISLSFFLIPSLSRLNISKPSLNNHTTF